MKTTRTVQELIDNPKIPIIREIISPNMMSGDEVMIAVADPLSSKGLPVDNDYHIVGYVNASQLSSGRGVTNVGELGSKALFTILTTGTMQASLQRMFVKMSLLKAIYSVLDYETISPELANSEVWIDLDDPIFDRPINMMFIYFDNNAESQDLTARTPMQKIILRNAVIGSIGMNIGEGSRMIMESCTIAWEETQEQSG